MKYNLLILIVLLLPKEDSGKILFQIEYVRYRSTGWGNPYEKFILKQVDNNKYVLNVESCFISKYMVLEDSVLQVFRNKIGEFEALNKSYKHSECKTYYQGSYVDYIKLKAIINDKRHNIRFHCRRYSRGSSVTHQCKVYDKYEAIIDLVETIAEKSD